VSDARKGVRTGDAGNVNRIPRERRRSAVYERQRLRRWWRIVDSKGIVKTLQFLYDSCLVVI
jgi:hypothetical protein